jgi:hypothetical protein
MLECKDGKLFSAWKAVKLSGHQEKDPALGNDSYLRK